MTQDKLCLMASFSVLNKVLLFDYCFFRLCLQGNLVSLDADFDEEKERLLQQLEEVKRTIHATEFGNNR